MQMHAERPVSVTEACKSALIIEKHCDAMHSQARKSLQFVHISPSPSEVCVGCGRTRVSRTVRALLRAAFHARRKTERAILTYWRSGGGAAHAPGN